jgi:hypothetical protein
MFEIARDPRRVHLAERRQDVVHLGPLQIDEDALPDAGFLDDLAPRRAIGEFAPFHAAGHRLPKPKGPPPLQQQEFAGVGVDHDQNRFRAPIGLISHWDFGRSIGFGHSGNLGVISRS